MISIIILNYNGRDFIGKTIESVLFGDFQDFEVIFFDNNSLDGSYEFVKEKYSGHRKIKIIKSSKNLGFAGGNNKAFEYTKGEVVFFLNSDAFIEKNCLVKIHEFFNDHKDAGIAQCKIKMAKEKDFIENAGNYSDTLGLAYIIGYNEKDNDQYEDVRKIFTANGAAFAMRREIFEKLKGFDEDYFLLYEETDLCWRARIAGAEIYYLPMALVYHLGSASLQKKKKRKKAGSLDSTYLYIRNRMDSMIKNYELKNLAAYLPAHLVFMFFYSLYYLTRGRFESFISLYKAVFYNLFHLKHILDKRKIVQKTRVIRDSEFFKKNYIKSFSFVRIINKVLRKNVDK